MKKKKDNNVIFAVFGLAILGVLFLTISQYSNRFSTEDEGDIDALLEKLEEVEAKQTEEISLPYMSVSAARKQLYTLFVDIRPLDDYRLSHIRKSIHIEEFVPEDHEQIQNIVLIQEDDGNDSDNAKLAELIKSFPEKFKVTVLSGGYEAWRQSGIPIVRRGELNNATDQLQVAPVEPRDVIAAMESVDSDVLLIDTRSERAYAASHAAGAVNIPYLELEKRSSEVKFGKDIYVYGQDSLQSFYAGFLLFELSFVGTQTINGGFDAWVEFDYPTEGENGVEAAVQTVDDEEVDPRDAAQAAAEQNDGAEDTQ